MRVLHLSTYDVKGGAALAAHRLHLGLNAAGTESWMLVRRRYGDSRNVVGPRGGLALLAAQWRRRRERWRARSGGWKGSGRFTPGMTGGAFARQVAEVAPDVVHLHWLADGFVDVRELVSLGRPLVWTFHDLWAFTGGCHYAGDCRRYTDTCGCCPLLGSRTEADLSRRGWERKQTAYAGLRLVGVAPSRWMHAAAAESSLWRGRDVRVVPNGIDLAQFASADQAEARRGLGLPTGRVVVLAGASDFRRDPRKGIDLFAGLAQRLSVLDPARYAFVTFGTGGAEKYEFKGVEITELGAIEDPEKLASAYAAADVFVAPSREDNLPNTLLEALACGTPAASFQLGGVPDIVDDAEDGFLVAPFEVETLAARIHDAATTPSRLAAMRATARRKAEARFGIGTMVAAYTAIYRELAGVS